MPAVLRINGALVPSYNNHKVNLIGTILNCSPQRGIIKTTDDKSVSLIFTTPLNAPPEKGRIVEVTGTVVESNKINVDDFVVFSPNQDFDAALYNEFVKFYVTHSHRFDP